MHRRILKCDAMRLILGMLGCIVLSSCAPSFKTVLSQYNEAPICCKGYQDFDYEKLDMPCSKSFWIDEGSKAFAFDTGMSYFKAFELPKSPPPYSIVVRSYLLGSSFESAYLFSPAVLFLDERFAVTRSLKKGVFHFVNASFFEVFGTAAMMKMFEADIPFDRENTNDRYMIILTTDELQKETTEHTVPVFSPIILPGFVSAIPTGRSETYHIPHSPMGKLKVKVRARQSD